MFDLSDDDWEFTLRTHLFGTIYCASEAARAMREQGRGGSIITVVSDAFYMGLETLLPYGTAKGGIYGFLRGLAAEVTPLGISVNAVAPPMTRTAPVEEFLESRETGGAPEAELDFYRATIQEPDEVALITVALASEQGRTLSGRVFTMTRDTLAFLRPNVPTTVRAEGPWTVEALGAAATAFPD